MIHKHLFGHSNVTKNGFRLRSREPSRLEGFSDAVFGFALTLLVVSQQVPETFDELQKIMRGFFGFAVCFIALFRVWYTQHIWFRRYDMEDAYTAILNGVLLFVVMFYVYPLKFLVDLIIGRFTGAGTTVHLPDGTDKPIIEANQLSLIYIFYFAGFATVGLVFALLYFHAYRCREALDLNEVEVFETLVEVSSNLLVVLIGGLSVGLMLLVGTRYFTPGLLAYLIVTPALTVALQSRVRIRRRRLRARMQQDNDVAPIPADAPTD